MLTLTKQEKPLSKCCSSFNIDQETHNQHKSSSLFDKNYDIPLGNFNSLQPELPLLKKLNESSFSYDDFFEILSTHRNGSAPGLNVIPYKVYKKCSTISKFIFQFFKLVSNDVKFPFNGKLLKRNAFPNLAVLPRTNSLTFAQ